LRFFFVYSVDVSGDLLRPACTWAKVAVGSVARGAASIPPRRDFVVAS